MRLVYNSNSTMHLPALMQIRVARRDRLGRGLPARRAPSAVPRPGLFGRQPARGARRARAGEHGRPRRRRALATGRARGDARGGRGADATGHRRRRLERAAAQRPGRTRRAVQRAGRAVAGRAAPRHEPGRACRGGHRGPVRDPLLPRAGRLDAARIARPGRRGDRRGRARQRRPRPRFLAPVAARHDARRRRPARSALHLRGRLRRLARSGRLAVARPALTLRVARRGRDPAARMGRRGPRDGLRRLVGQRAVQPAPLGMGGPVRGRRRVSGRCSGACSRIRRPGRDIDAARRTRCYGCAIGCRMEGAVRMQASACRHPGDRARPARASIADTV